MNYHVYVCMYFISLKLHVDNDLYTIVWNIYNKYQIHVKYSFHNYCLKKTISTATAT